jgi:hypothetical protein
MFPSPIYSLFNLNYKSLFFGTRREKRKTKGKGKKGII